MPCTGLHHAFVSEARVKKERGSRAFWALLPPAGNRCLTCEPSAQAFGLVWFDPSAPAAMSGRGNPQEVCPKYSVEHVADPEGTKETVHIAVALPGTGVQALY
jgi:hypothetical protein